MWPSYVLDLLLTRLQVGSAHPSDPTARITRGLLKYTQSLRRTFAVDYRLCSAEPFPRANGFPAALLDILAGYRYLVHSAHFQPKNIILLVIRLEEILRLRWFVTFLNTKRPFFLPLGA